MWHQLTLTSIPTASIEIISSLLESNGALSITLEDADDTPIFEPSPGAMPLWHEVNLTALYQNKDALTDALTLISTLFPTLSYSHIEFEDKAWERECLNAFKPMSFGDNLRIYPSWSVPDNLKPTDILLDPGLAFGTGAHPTTALCLSWLDKHPLNNQTVIDMGTGSGILTIAALKMGAAHVTAIDIDEQALTATKANVCQNQLSLNQVSMMFPNPSAYPKADLIIANIYPINLKVLDLWSENYR
jgi:ribosomal protein L11 methyltransferase